MIRAAILCGVVLGSPVGAAETVSFSYDALGRLTQSASTGSVNNGVTASLSYDAAGNRTNYTVTGSPNMASIDSLGGAGGVGSIMRLRGYAPVRAVR